jgi:DsbC/DsbD-like thiol-disulfide interchange protein
MRSPLVLALLIVATALASPVAQVREHRGLAITQIAAAPRTGSRVAQVGVDITADRGLHVYAPGNPGYAPVELELDPVDGMRVRALELPKPRELLFNLSEPVFVFEGRFRVALDVELSARQAAILAKRGSLTLKGRLRYQACTATICLRPVVTTLTWKIHRDRFRARPSAVR